MTLSTEYKKQLKDAWNNLESDQLRKIYWILNRDKNKYYISELELFKMETYKEILIERYEW